MPTITTFAEAQDALRPLYQNARTLYGMEVMEALMASLDNPQDKLRIIHVAGTSGKTSTSYYCAALLQQQGQTVGLTVSPHVDTINERMQINGQLMPEAEYCKLLSEFLELVNESGVKPSYFELLTAMAYWEFARRGLDYAVIEVGMGGEMDATNVISRPDKVCVITDIGLDHTEILGDTLDKIAWYKAGIIKPGSHAFMYRQGDEVMAVVREASQANQASLHELDESSEITLPGLPLFQQRNLGLARQVVDYVNQRDGRAPLNESDLEAASQIVIPARLERFNVAGKTVIVDGSHNSQKLATLLESVQQLYPQQNMAVLCAFVEGNDQRWQEGLQTLLPAVKSVIFTTFHSEKDYPKSSVETDQLVKFCDLHGFKNYAIEPDPAAAYEKLLEQAEPLLLVTGSFYLLNHVRPLIVEQA